jgi:hypothetical protein
MSYMPVDEKPKCRWLDCVAGGGLAGNGVCFLNGQWDNPSCAEFLDETAFLLMNYVTWHLFANGSYEIEIG